MNAIPRPLSVTILACLFVAVGAFGVVSHYSEFWPLTTVRLGVVIELVELAAIVAGVFMLSGRNWARWLALAWMAVHVILSAFNSLKEVAVHAVLFVVIAWLLFRPDAVQYFRSAQTD